MDGMPDLEKIMKSLSENDEVKNLIKNLKGNSSASEDGNVKRDGEEREKTETSNESASDKLPEIISALSPLMKGKMSGGSNADTEKRNRLLAALKPYLSAPRQEMIDTVTSLSKMTGILDLFAGGKQ